MQAARVTSPLLALAAVVVAGCSGSDTTGTASSSSGSGGVPDVPRGGVNLEIYATAEQSCPIGNTHVDVGDLKSAPRKLVYDGQDGADIACNVTPQGASFSAAGSIDHGAVSVGFQLMIADKAASAIGTIQVADPATGELYTSQKPCVFQFAPSTDQHVEAGALWVQFDCADLVSATDATKACSSRYGYLEVQNCAKQ